MSDGKKKNWMMDSLLEFLRELHKEDAITEALRTIDDDPQ